MHATPPLNVIADTYGKRPDWSPIAQAPHPVTGIIRHTPDPNGYHRAGDFGLPAGATMVPAATIKGASRGFSMTPGKVQVVVGDNGEGFEVDMSKITKQDVNDAMMHTYEQDPMEAYRALHEHQQQVSPARSAVPTPLSSTDTAGRELPPIPTTIPERSGGGDTAPAYVPAPQPQPQLYYPNPPQFMQPQMPMVDPRTDMLLQQMRELQDMFGKLAADRSPSGPTGPVGTPGPPGPSSEPPKEAFSSRQPPEAEIFAADIGMPYLTSPPSPPKRKVRFQLPGGGTYSTRFHHYEQQGAWLFLYLDTRYESDRFLPPPADQESPMTIHLGEGDEQHSVCMLEDGGVQHHGCLQVISLLVLD